MALNELAQSFRDLHKPGQPLLLANVYDGITARAIASIGSCQALATSLSSVAAAQGLSPDRLDMDTNLRAGRVVARIARDFNLPLSIEFGSGYGDQLEQGMKQIIDLGAVGINLDDADTQTSKLYSIDEAASRIRRAVRASVSSGVPDFVVNARTDTLMHGGTIEDAITRGKAYLDAGAFNVFVLGGSERGGITTVEVMELTEAFNGQLNVSVKLAKGGLTVKDLAGIGVSRCSIGPQLQFVGAKAAVEVAEEFLKGGLR
ncbi:Phosphoenolpyruvate/pyruvate domain-containing protein [Rhizodiscina lignyota]|uniref:Phosphoenolpyruvate/pyruvate domain-containing protein n=1 Tax=Rhizodiscina lignyota TaxID=1504668 RepID=A0A9P4IIP1_9PEZI|nr:Phosphoenolpyruvate/pyruvate domain-containing protein [Rhizodiscina lignyota]